MLLESNSEYDHVERETGRNEIILFYMEVVDDVASKKIVSDPPSIDGHKNLLICFFQNGEISRLLHHQPAYIE